MRQSYFTVSLCAYETRGECQHIALTHGKHFVQERILFLILRQEQPMSMNGKNRPGHPSTESVGVFNLHTSDYRRCNPLTKDVPQSHALTAGKACSRLTSSSTDSRQVAAKMGSVLVIILPASCQSSTSNNNDFQIFRCFYSIKAVVHLLMSQ